MNDELSSISKNMVEMLTSSGEIASRMFQDIPPIVLTTLFADYACQLIIEFYFITTNEKYSKSELLEAMAEACKEDMISRRIREMNDARN